MAIGLRGENLIFLLSQVRAGSTMLQRMLASHPEIHTASEPWLMLHPLKAWHENDYYTVGDEEKFERATLLDFLQALPEGEDAYIEGVRRMYSYLYGRALQPSGKRYFLDKTPAYYTIIPDLYRVFPEARYIIMFRNPLAVFASVLDRWIQGDWLKLHIFAHDLLEAPRLLVRGSEQLGDRRVIVRYKPLVENPGAEVQRICAAMGMAFVPEMIHYGRTELPRWRLGDEGEIYQQERPTDRNVSKWIQGLEHPQVWRFTSDYLHALGRETIEQMGFSYDDCQRILVARRPSRLSLKGTLPLSLVLRRPIDGGVRHGGRKLLDTTKRRVAFALSNMAIHDTGTSTRTIRGRKRRSSRRAIAALPYSSRGPEIGPPRR